MTTLPLSTEKTLDKAEFERLFKTYYPGLCNFALKYVADPDTAKEVVQTVFMNLWQKRETINLDTSLKAFLFRSVYNRSLNQLRDNKKFVSFDASSEEDDGGYAERNHPSVTPAHMEEAELQGQINAALAKLPERCREIFLMSRFQEMKYQEIADKLNISVKTVEVQMSKALRILREQLKDQLPLLLLLLWFKNFH